MERHYGLLKTVDVVDWTYPVFVPLRGMPCPVKDERFVIKSL